MADHGAEDLVPRLQAVFARRARGMDGREGSARGRSDGSGPLEGTAATTSTAHDLNGGENR